MEIDEFKRLLKASGPVKNCPVSRTLELLNGRWTARIIFELEKFSSVRFGELKRNIDGITNTMLSSTLKKLEQEKIVGRKVFDEIPVRVEYSLTEKGEAMLPIFYEMAQWGEKYL